MAPASISLSSRDGNGARVKPSAAQAAAIIASDYSGVLLGGNFFGGPLRSKPVARDG
jgi:hypothetical protein